MSFKWKRKPKKRENGKSLEIEKPLIGINNKKRVINKNFEHSGSSFGTVMDFNGIKVLC